MKFRRLTLKQKTKLGIRIFKNLIKFSKKYDKFLTQLEQITDKVEISFSQNISKFKEGAAPFVKFFIAKKGSALKKIEIGTDVFSYFPNLSYALICMCFFIFLKKLNPHKAGSYAKSDFKANKC